MFLLYPSNSSPRHLICYTCVHCFHQILAAVTNFAHIVPILSSNSESVLKTGLVSHMNSDFDVPYIKIDQKKMLDPSIPHPFGVGNFYFGQKVVTRSSFRGHKVFVDFDQVF